MNNVVKTILTTAGAITVAKVVDKTLLPAVGLSGVKKRKTTKRKSSTSKSNKRKSGTTRRKTKRK